MKRYGTINGMKNTLIVLVILCVSACGGPEERKQASIMNEIERQVTLPEGALAIEKYARYYSDKGGKVVAVYTIPYHADLTATCEELTENLSSRSVECPPEAQQLSAGERQWVSFNELPGISDGGCTVVNVLFNPATHKVENVQCNGVA